MHECLPAGRMIGHRPHGREGRRGCNGLRAGWGISVRPKAENPTKRVVRVSVFGLSLHHLVHCKERKIILVHAVVKVSAMQTQQRTTS